MADGFIVGKLNVYPFTFTRVNARISIKSKIYIRIKYINILNHIKNFFCKHFSASSVIFRNLPVACA